MEYNIQNAVVLIATVQSAKVSRQTKPSLIYKNHLNLEGIPPTIKPDKNAVSPMEIPIHGIYANPEELIKKPTKSPRKHAANPNSGPIISPESADIISVKENCVSNSLNSNIFAATINAVTTPI